MPRALLLDEDLTIRMGIREAFSSQGHRDAIIKVEFSGICGSDLHAIATGAWITYWPATLGHEVVGTLTDPGSTLLANGARVVADSRIACGMCDGCTRSRTLCENLSWLGESRPGGFAQSVSVPAANVVKVPVGLAPNIAVLAEPLAVAMNVVDKIPRAVTGVLILGYGPVGALVHSEIARREPRAAVFVAEPDAFRAALAAERGATILAGSEESTVEAVVDAAGYPGSIEQAFIAVRPGGEIVVVALSDAPIGIRAGGLVEKAVTITGSIGFDDHHLVDALDLLAVNPERYAPLISHVVPLSELADFLTDGTPVQSAKIIVDCQT